MTLEESSILIVDDEPVLRMRFCIVLRQLGASVHVAAHGAEALEVLARERVDLMLTDKQMPVMNGPVLLDTLQERGVTVPSVLFVNGVEPEKESDLRRWGVVETLTKPVHPERLVAALRGVLEGISANHTHGQ